MRDIAERLQNGVNIHTLYLHGLIGKSTVTLPPWIDWLINRDFTSMG